LESTLKRAKEAEEREKRYRESEKDAEKMRKEKALLEFEEDRRLRSEKDERGTYSLAVLQFDSDYIRSF